MMSIWSQAKDMAAQTPSDRNRYVDFLRAISILVVITGHWLIAALYYHDGSLTPSDLLVIQPNAQWLTWLFQVMPIFFIVGGYANAVSLESARRREVGYAGWLAAALPPIAAGGLVRCRGAADDPKATFKFSCRSSISPSRISPERSIRGWRSSW